MPQANVLCDRFNVTYGNVMENVMSFSLNVIHVPCYCPLKIMLFNVENKMIRLPFLGKIPFFVCWEWILYHHEYQESRTRITNTSIKKSVKLKREWLYFLICKCHDMKCHLHYI